MGCTVTGPRRERLGDNFREVKLPGHNLPVTAAGSLLMVVGTVAKCLGLSAPEVRDTMGQVTVNLLVGGAAGGLVTMNLFKLKTRRGQKYSLADAGAGVHTMNGQPRSSVHVTNRKWSYLTAFNGFYTGMICVSGVGADLPSWAAFVAGLVGGLVFFLMAGLVRLNKIDDPVHGIGVHISGGIVGAVVVGLVNVAKTRSGIKIGWEMVGVVAVSAWSTLSFLFILLPLLLCGKLRIKDCQERDGIDAVKIKEQSHEVSTPAEPAATSRTRTTPDVFLSPAPSRTARGGELACPLSAISRVSQPGRCSPQDVSPRLVQQRPSPGGSIQQLGVAAPPSYPTSTMVRTQRCGLAVPEVTITSSNSASTSVVDSEAPLINSTSNTTASSKATLSLDMRELKRNLRKQKGKLKKTNSIYKAAPADVEAADPDSSTSSSCGRGSVKSVKSAVVRQVASVAGNKDNFNYLAATSSLQPAVEEASTGENVTAEENDTDIDITKFLKSPEPSWTKGRGVTETKEAVDHIIRREERERARLREKLGRCANGNWVNVGYYNTLLGMSYNSFNTAVQMLQEEPDLIVLAAQEWDQEPSVVAMGFLLEMAAVALKNEGAVEKLTEVGGVVTPVDDGNDQKLSSKKARRDSKEIEADNRIKEGIAEGKENHLDFDLLEQGQFLQQYLSLLNHFEI